MSDDQLPGEEGAAGDGVAPPSIPPGLFDGPDWSPRSRRRRHSAGRRPGSSSSDSPPESGSEPLLEAAVDSVPGTPPAEAGSDGASDTVPGGRSPDRMRVRRRSRRARKRKRQRRAGWVLLGFGVLLLAGGAWILVTGLMAKSALQDVRHDVATLRSQVTGGDFAAARQTADKLRGEAADAHSLTTGPAWAVAASLPGAGAVDTVRTVTAEVDVIAGQVLPSLVQVSETIDPSHLRGADGVVNLAPVRAAAPALTAAVQRLGAATRAVQDTDTSTGIGPVDRGRSELLTELDKLNGTLGSAASAAQLLPKLLGGQGTQRYFVAFQNEAEMRGTGGLPGAFAIVRAEGGKITFERFESDTTLLGRRVPGLTLDSTYTGLGAKFSAQTNQLFRTIWGDGPMIDYRDSNLSINFPYAAQIWIAMWRQYSGEQVDGAATLDPTALSYLLKVTGPAKTASGQVVSAANVVALTQKTGYSRYPSISAADQSERKKFLLDVAQAASHRVVDGRTSATALVRAGAHAVHERRLLFYSTDQATEQVIARYSLGGAMPTDARAFAAPVVNNYGGTKLDYYLQRSVVWSAQGCGSTRTVTVTFTLTNGAPANLPAYVTYRADTPPAGAEPGDNNLFVTYYATSGAQFRSVTVDGANVPLATNGNLLNHQVNSIHLPLPRGATRTVVFTYLEPNRGAPDVWRQPGVNPLSVKVSAPSC